jgi:hypothetical protein
MITLAEARRVIAAAEQKAKSIGQPMNIAVVDAGGNLVAHVRMDNWIKGGSGAWTLPNREPKEDGGSRIRLAFVR